MEYLFLVITKEKMNRILFGLGLSIYSLAIFSLGGYFTPPKVEIVKEECPRLAWSAYECIVHHKELGYTKLFTGFNCREAVEEAYKKGQRNFSTEAIK